MWVLSIGLKQFWLLPGERYIVGRAASRISASSVDIALSEPSVSRRHCLIQVTQPEGALAHPSARSELRVTDLGSRFGTHIHKKPLIPNEPMLLDAKLAGSASVVLGGAARLKFEWVPLVITYSTGKTGLEHEDLWQEAVKVLEPLDVRLVPNLVKGTSVFVCAEQTAAFYYALVLNLEIVGLNYFKALNDRALESKTGVLDLLVDPQTYELDECFRPDQQRQSVFKTQKFALSSEINPVWGRIIAAAGGSIVQLPERRSCYFLAANEQDAKQHGLNYVLEEDIGRCIIECRRICDLDVLKLPPPNSKRKQVREELILENENESENSNFFHPNKIDRSKFSAKSEAKLAPQSKPLKRSKKVTTKHIDELHLDSESESELEPLDLDTVEELAATENCLQLTTPPSITAPITTDKPNFKAFRNSRIPQTPVIKFNSEFIDDAPKDDEFAEINTSSNSMKKEQNVHIPLQLSSSDSEPEFESANEVLNPPNRRTQQLPAKGILANIGDPSDGGFSFD